MSPKVQSLLKTVGIAVAAVVAAGAGYVDCTVANFNESLDKVYDVPLPAIARSADPAVLARGKHLVETLGGCASSHCHGANLAGGEPIVMGPLGTASRRTGVPCASCPSRTSRGFPTPT